MMQRLLMAVVRGYRLLLSPWLGSACRFEPTCSAYSLQALEQHGAAVGSYLTVRRLARCHPWCDGGHDPVPQQKPRLFSFLDDASDSSATTQPSSPKKSSADFFILRRMSADTCGGAIFLPCASTQASPLSALTMAYGIKSRSFCTSLSVNLRPIKRLTA